MVLFVIRKLPSVSHNLKPFRKYELRITNNTSKPMDEKNKNPVADSEKTHRETQRNTNVPPRNS